MADVAAIFKAYDIRGRVPEQLDEGVARAVGAAFSRLIARRGGEGADAGVVVGHDMRSTSPGLAQAFAEGVQDDGRDVVSIGLAATDEVYFASGSLNVPAAMVTASHNPAAYNGLKLCLAGAAALSRATGLDDMHDEILERGCDPSVSSPRGTLREVDMLTAYVEHLHRLVAVTGRRLRIVVDAANAMAGLTAPAVFEGIDAEIIPLYFELDGTFPHHEANPLVADNLRDLRKLVLAEGADLGLAFDGDADRCFAVDELGKPVSPSVLTSLIAVRELAAHPGATVIHNLITSRSVPETITAHGGIPVRTPVGHSLIKAEMARSGAVFGGEHSGHYYFKDFWYADSGMLAALHLVAAMAGTDRPLSELAADFSPYTSSGELNLTVVDVEASMAQVEAEASRYADITIDRLDGVSLIGEDWWLNVRASNTEPLLRLNVEAADAAKMADVRDSVLAKLRRQT